MDNCSNGRLHHVLHGWFSGMSEVIKLHKEGLKSLCVSLGRRLLILISFNKLLVFTKYRGTCIFRAGFPRRETSASLTGFGQWFQKLLGGHSETGDEDMLKETVFSKKSHFNCQVGQKEPSSAPANIQHSRSWAWHPVWHTALAEGNPQATLLFCSFTLARSPTGAHLIQRFCETSLTVPNYGNWQVGKKKVNIPEGYSIFNSRAIQQRERLLQEPSTSWTTLHAEKTIGLILSLVHSDSGTH